MTIAVTPALKAKLETSTWQDQHVVTADGLHRWFGAFAEESLWGLGSPPRYPRSIAEGDFTILQRGTLTTDGRVLFEGMVYALVPRGEGPGSLVVCEPGGPPPA